MKPSKIPVEYPYFDGSSPICLASASEKRSSIVQKIIDQFASPLESSACDLDEEELRDYLKYGTIPHDLRRTALALDEQLAYNALIK